MLGSLRFVLAYFVFLTHFPDSGLKLRLGIMAVIIFYFISGYLMMKSYLRFQTYSASPITSFYADRCIKIFPQYLVVLLLTVFAYKWFGASTHDTYNGVSFEPIKILFDALLIPVNFAIGSSGDLFPAIGGSPIVPPAWSLSVEFHFYLLVPLLVFLPARALAFIAFCSAAMLTFSYYTTSSGWDLLHFGYRYVLPMLVVFIFGMAFASDDKFLKQLAFVIWAYFCALMLFLLPGFSAWYGWAVQEITIGMVIALPLFKYAKEFRFEKAFMVKFDSWLGDLSCPIFLTHYLGIYLAQHLFGVSSDEKIQFMFASVLIFMMMSIALAEFQRTVDSFRVRYRGFKSMRST